MKIRLGFISNSSVSSFTIYGWSAIDLSKYISQTIPVFKDVDIEIDKEQFEDNLLEEWEGEEWDIVSTNNSKGEQIIGLGTVGDEIDHYIQGTWEKFKYDPPSPEKQEKFNLIVKKLGLPKPKLYSETWYDG